MHQAAQTVAKTPVPKEEEGMGPNSLPSVAGQQALEHKRAREIPSQSSPPTQLLRLQGLVKTLRDSDESFFNSTSSICSLSPVS